MKELKKEDLLSKVHELSDLLEKERSKNQELRDMILEDSEELPDYKFVRLLLQDAIAESTQASWIYSYTDKQFTVSNRWLEIFGWDRDEFVNGWDQIYEVVHPGDRGQFKLFSDKAQLGRIEFPKKFRIIKSNKEIIYLRAIGALEFGDNGEAIKLYGILQDVTNKMLSENRLSAILENTYDLYLSVDSSYKLLTINSVGRDTFRKTLNVDIELGQNILELIPDFMKPIWKERYDRALNGERFVIEDQFEDAGIRYYSEVTFNPIWREDTVTGVSVVSHDITERKLAEAAMKEAKDFAESLVQTANAMIVVLDANGDIEVFNHAAQSITGYSFDELKGKNWFEVLCPREKYPAVWEEFGRLMEGGLPKNFENPVLTKTGEERHIVWQNSEINTNEKIVGTVSFGIDITDRKLASEALKESENKFRAFMERTPAYAYIKDAGLNHIYKNQKVAALGTKQVDSSRDIFDQETSEIIETADRDILLGNTEHVELEYNTKINGIDRWLKDIKFSITLPDNSKAIGGLAFDITEIKENQKQLEHYQSKLELLVAQRTSELQLANEELSQKNRALFDTNELLETQKLELEATLKELKETQTQLVQSEKMASLGVLTAGVAHEINNPLNFISSGVLALEVYFREELSNHLETVSPIIEGVKEGVRRSAKIVTSLNHFSRAGKGEFEHCDIHIIIDNCLVMLHNKLKNRIVVDKHYTDRKIELLGNEGKLHQAILNILANSSQAIEESGNIKITTEISNEFVSITIEDNGMGISEEDLPKITDPFFTTKAPGVGTGLGLAITYSILEEHDGEIIFRSTEGEGTSVILKLPKTK